MSFFFFFLSLWFDEGQIKMCAALSVMVNIFGWMRSAKTRLSCGRLWATVRCHSHFATPPAAAACDTDTRQRTCHVYSTFQRERERERGKNTLRRFPPFGRRHIQHVPRHLAVRWTSLPLSSIILITSMGKCLIHGDHSVLPGSNLMLAHSTSPWTQFHLFIFNPNPLSPPPPAESRCGMWPWNWKQCIQNVSVCSSGAKISLLRLLFLYYAYKKL